MTAFFVIQAIIIVLVLIAAFLYIENNYIDVTKYKLQSPAVDSRIRIAQLSDLHSKPFWEVIDKLKQQRPDVIVITGDYINDHGKNKDKMFAFGEELLKIAPVYYITGNHERRLAHFKELMDELDELGFVVLRNQAAIENIRGSKVYLLGLDENQGNFDDYKARKNGTFAYEDMSPYLKQFERLQGYKILLSHYPENFEAIAEHNYSQYDFDLQLSGHAHGGQFNLPFFGPVFSPGQGIHPKYAKGAFGTHPKLIVSRGLANAEFPFRLFNHPEIVIITVTRQIKQ